MEWILMIALTGTCNYNDKPVVVVEGFETQRFCENAERELKQVSIKLGLGMTGSCLPIRKRED